MAINMMDVVNKNGDKIDTKKLEKELGVTVCTISALRGEGVMEAAQKAVDIASSGVKTIPMHTFGGSVEHALATLRRPLSTHFLRNSRDGTLSKYLSVTKRCLNSSIYQLKRLNILKTT